MKKYTQINNISGWIAFLISAIVYLLTIESTASFWDCGEFIATAFKLEVGHPPGAPLFMIIARVFTLLASDVTRVPVMVNAMSALASAFTILFLFWSITHLARRLVIQNGEEPSSGQIVAIMASGFVGALAYTFSDSFWFSAVEGEVYAMSSFFTAIVFWAVLKWENVADEPHANRWLIFIAYMMGLSIGVHLLNLLAIPAIVFVYYFKKYKPTRWGVVGALMVSVALLGGIMYIIIPGVFKIASWFEIIFTNGFSLPYSSGTIIYAILLIGSLTWGLSYTLKYKKVLANTIILGVVVILIGYSSFAMIIIRSLADTPINENAPSNVFSLMSYLNREQYGDRPLLYGQYFNAPAISSIDKTTYIPKNGKYVESYLKTTYEFDNRFMTFFPRMYSPSEDHAEEYKKWANIKGKPVKVRNQNGEQEVRNVPTFGENLLFFFRYQLGHMYLRYFMWNFVGRQNDVQSQGEFQNGNWISGIKPIDALFIGNQDSLTDDMLNHPARNRYYFLPLILGLLGIFYQLFTRKDKQNAFVVFLLFFLTGAAIVVYLNQYPLQPRERDYAFAGSFYAFAIWVGLGVLALYEALAKYMSRTTSAALAGAACMVVPVVMGVENWDDHDRSGRYVARDFAANYLNSCEPNAILFTNGDNDTFPLWYAQEVEGIRTDVRVVNLSLLGTDWYIDQMKKRAYDSAPLRISMNRDQYVQGTRDIVYFYERFDQPVELKSVVDFVASDRPDTKLQVPGEKPIDYFPTKKMKLTVDRKKVLATGTVAAKDSSQIVPVMEWSLKGRYIQKSELLMLDIIANNNWDRPIYFVTPYGDADIGISDYLQLDGFVYRLVPIKTKAKDFLSVGRINPDLLYDKYVNKFAWGRMNAPDVSIDHNIQRTATVLRLRNNFNRLANELIRENRKDSALKVLDRIVELMPNEKFPYDFFMIGLAESYYKLNETEKANQIVRRYVGICQQNLRYYFSLDSRFDSAADYDKQVNIQTLQELSGLADRYGQNEIKAEAEQFITQYMDMYYKGSRATR